ncbi:MAG: hypothetical protein Q8L46_01680 [candidate division WWE3 bacterium]|nr:hypothetical protein [candidate division WWE3 bacterium]
MRALLIPVVTTWRFSKPDLPGRLVLLTSKLIEVFLTAEAPGHHTVLACMLTQRMSAERARLGVKILVILSPGLVDLLPNLTFFII